MKRAIFVASLLGLAAACEHPGAPDHTAESQGRVDSLAPEPAPRATVERYPAPAANQLGSQGMQPEPRSNTPGGIAAELHGTVPERDQAAQDEEMLEMPGSTAYNDAPTAP